jgi:hypothetical protein
VDGFEFVAVGLVRRSDWPSPTPRRQPEERTAADEGHPSDAHDSTGVTPGRGHLPLGEFVPVVVVEFEGADVLVVADAFDDDDDTAVVVAAVVGGVVSVGGDDVDDVVVVGGSGSPVSRTLQPACRPAIGRGRGRARHSCRRLCAALTCARLVVLGVLTPKESACEGLHVVASRVSRTTWSNTDNMAARRVGSRRWVRSMAGRPFSRSAPIASNDTPIASLIWRRTLSRAVRSAKGAFIDWNWTTRSPRVRAENVNCGPPRTRSSCAHPLALGTGAELNQKAVTVSPSEEVTDAHLEPGRCGQLRSQ